MTCCTRPTIANMGHVKGFEPDRQATTNRMCLKCGRHWYGPEGAAAEYTRAQWDAWVTGALQADLDAKYLEGYL